VERTQGDQAPAGDRFPTAGLRHRRKPAAARPSAPRTNARHAARGPKKTVGRGKEGESNGSPLAELPATPRPHPPSRSQEHCDRPGAHQDLVQQHDRRPDRQGGQRDRLGVPPARPGVQGLAQVDAVWPRRSPPTRRRARGMEHGLQKVEVFVKGPGSGRETADSLAAGSGAGDSRCQGTFSPQAHNGRPPRKKRRRV